MECTNTPSEDRASFLPTPDKDLAHDRIPPDTDRCPIKAIPYRQAWRQTSFRSPPQTMYSLTQYSCAWSDSGGGALGHPIEYIQLNTVDEPVSICKYCGLRFKAKPHHH